MEWAFDILLTAYSFLGPMKSIQENVTEVTSIAEETNVITKQTNQNVAQIKDKVNEMNG